MKYKEIFFWITVILVAFLISIITRQTNATPSQLLDANQNLFFSKNILVSGDLSYVNPYNEKYSQIFGFRTTFIDGGGLNLPATHLGYIYVLSIFRLALLDEIFFITFFLLVLSAAYVKKLATLLFDAKTSYIAVIGFLFFSSVIYWSTAYINDVAALFFFIVAMYYFFRYLESERQIEGILFALFYFVAVFIRFSYLPVLVSFVIAFVFVRKPNKKALFVGLFLFVNILLLFIFNFFNYNFFLGPVSNQVLRRLSPNIISKDSLEGVSLVSNFFVFSNSEVFINNIKNYLLGLQIVFFFVPSLITVFKGLQKKNRNLLPFSLFFVTTVLILASLYLGKEWSGYSSTFLINSMYTRYLLPMYLLFIIAGSYSLRKYLSRFSKSFAVVFLVGFIIMFMAINFQLVSPQLNYNSGLDFERKFSIDVINNTNGDSVIFTTYFDKYLFPTRQTAIYTTFEKDTRKENTANLIKDLLADGKEVYFIDENYLKDYDEFTLKDDYFPYFTKAGLEPKNVSFRLYKIELTK